MLLYKVISAVAALLYSPWLFFKKGPHPKGQFIAERFGLAEYSKADIWVHAVSVGEVLAALPFIKSLRKTYPGSRIVLSTTTYTGQNVARQHFPEADRIMYIPVDSVIAAGRVVRAVRPSLFITVETELWPLLFSELRKAGSKIMVVNGRLSPGSFRGYRMIRFFIKEVLSLVDSILMQGERDAERIIGIGAEPDRVSVMGNLKFDIEPGNSESSDWLDDVTGEILLAASTHNGEDEIILDAYDMLKKSRQDLRLIIAPRHPERFDQVYRLMTLTGYKCSKRSSLDPDSDIILLDTVGELFGLFARSDAAFIGGSLVPAGGHNILEPAFWGKPILFGPHMENFPVAGDFISRGAAAEVHNEKEVCDTLNSLLDDREKASEMGKKAKDIVEQNRGAVNKALDAVRSLVGNL